MRSNRISGLSEVPTYCNPTNFKTSTVPGDGCRFIVHAAAHTGCAYRNSDIRLHTPHSNFAHVQDISTATFKLAYC